jgi:hypothetical protein
MGRAIAALIATRTMTTIAMITTIITTTIIIVITAVTTMTIDGSNGGDSGR